MTTLTRDRSGLLRLWLELEPPWLTRAHGAGGGAGVVAVAGSFRRGEYPDIYRWGCGVSGYDEDDCLDLLRKHVFGGRALPSVTRRIRSVDVSMLPERVRASLGVTVYRGVWFPALNRQPPA